MTTDATPRLGATGPARRARGALPTLLLVSHAPEAILENCPRSLLLTAGRLAADGRSRDILARYAAEISRADPASPSR